MKKAFFLIFMTVSFGFTSGIEWYEDFDTAKKAVTETKPLMLMYTRPDCKVCQFMKNRVFTQYSVEQYILNNFVPLEIDLETEDAIDGYKVFGTPTFYFINVKNEKIDLIVGGAKAEDFLNKLRKIKAKSLR